MSGAGIHHIEAVMRNRRPARLPLYEHLVNVEFMEAVLDARFAGLAAGVPAPSSRPL